MNDTLDLRPYLRALQAHWPWPLLAAASAGVLALLITFLIPPTYEATALVAVTEPRQVLQFDPRIEAATNRQPLDALPGLATSDEMLQRLLDQADLPADGPENVAALRRLVDAAAGDTPSIIQLTVRYRDAARTAALANLWATLFVDWTNEIFGDQGGEQVVFFAAQLDDARAELTAAETALVEFETRNRAALLTGEIAALQNRQAGILQRTSDIALLSADIDALRDQAAAAPAGRVPTFADQLTLLFLQLEAFDAAGGAALQLTLPADGVLAAATAGDTLTLLDDLGAALTTRQAALDAALDNLEPDLFALQEAQQALRIEEARLRNTQDIAADTVTALARKLAEEKITAQDETSGVRLASGAAVVDEKVAPRRALNAVAAAVVALFLALLALVGLTWWRQTSPPAPG